MDTNSSLLYYIQTCETDSVTDTGPLITFIHKGETCLAVLHFAVCSALMEHVCNCRRGIAALGSR